MTYLVICTVALLASGLTFFSGFGLGTLLLPAFALFFPVEQAIALTAIVHFLNSLFKVVLIGRLADRRAILLFGIPAIGSAVLGAWLLLHLSDLQPLATYTLLGREMQVTPVKLTVGLLLFVFAVFELTPSSSSLAFRPTYLPLGGILSGFFGGLTGMQGALRSAFLIKAGLTKEGYIATGALLACLIDFTRLGVYVPNIIAANVQIDYTILSAAVLSAFSGAWLGNRFLKKMTLRSVQIIVAMMLLAVAFGLMSGVL